MHFTVLYTALCSAGLRCSSECKPVHYAVQGSGQCIALCTASVQCEMQSAVQSANKCIMQCSAMCIKHCTSAVQ